MLEMTTQGAISRSRATIHALFSGDPGREFETARPPDSCEAVVPKKGRGNTMKTSGITLSIALILLHSVSARAAVIFSNVASAPSAYTAGWGVSGPTVSGALAQQDVGSPFLSSQAATLDTIEVALKYNSGPNRFDILLLSDDHGLPGSVLEMLTAADVPRPWDVRPTASSH